MATSSSNRSLSLCIYGIIPLFCWALLLQSPSSMVYAQTEDSLLPPMPSFKFNTDNATSFLNGFVKRFDSTKNFTYTPGKLLSRIRERVHARMEDFRSRWLDTKLRLGNRTISLIDRIMGTLDRQKEKSGNDSSRETFGMFRSFLDSLRNTVQNMMQNLKERAPKQLVNWKDDLDVGSKSGGDGEREETDSKAISQLNAALKKLDKATRQKYNEI